MITLTAKDIVDATGGTLVLGGDDISAHSCVIDSREVVQGSLFAAFSGQSVDGHDYIGDAIEAGATVLLITESDVIEVIAQVTRPNQCSVIMVSDMLAAVQDLAIYMRSQINCPIIGITGSTGKTSTKELIASVLGQRFEVVATRHNQNNELGVPLTLLAASESTEVIVVEMGMRGRGEIAELAAILRPNIGVVSSVGPCHIEILGTLENIARTKAELLEVLPFDGLALFEASSPHRELFESLTDSTILTIGIEDPHAEVVASHLTLDRQGCPSAHVKTPVSELDIVLQIAGRHQILNALYAVAIAQYLDMTNEEIIVGLAQATLTGMRFSVCQNDTLDIAIINDAYNANPTSMEGAIRTLASMQSTARRILVAGDMLELGHISESAHTLIGALAGELGIDAVFAFGPRSAFTASGARSGGITDVFEFGDADIDKLIELLGLYVGAGDTVLVKGSRGMALERVVFAMGDADVC